MASKLPFEIRQAIIQVCGKSFWFKDPFKVFMIGCGVPEDMYDRYSDESKYKIARHILAELDRLGDDGHIIQRRILTELCKLRKVPDDQVPDRDAALSALRFLKELATTHDLLGQENKTERVSRSEEAKRKQAALLARALKMEQLRKNFAAIAASNEDPQSRGYSLEDFLVELFAVHEINYHPPYRTVTEQIDGHFELKSFDYLVEARWRKDPPKEADLGAFKTKVDKKFESTRGLFVSAVGFRPEVVLEFTKGVTSNILLMDGADLMLILEGHISLTDALEVKIQKAAREGIIFFPLSQRFGSD